MRAWVVDTFADDRYQGNPAAVILRPQGFPPSAAMQSIASGLALPTTAFVVPEGGTRYRIRWFTPRKELNLCGHATVASAGYLFDIEGADRAATLCFLTQMGPIYAARDGDYISIDLPRMDVSPCPPPPGLEPALGAAIVRCAQSADDLLIELESERAVAGLRPDFDALALFSCRGHVVTARADSPGADFVSRAFFPALGVAEDQVCVSAHCKLAPYWGARLHKRRMTGLQLSQQGGRLLVDTHGDRVRVLGTARVRSADGQAELADRWLEGARDSR